MFRLNFNIFMKCEILENNFYKFYDIVNSVIIMTNNLEVEYKNLLTITEFQSILKQFPFQAYFQQKNSYYDTPKQALKLAGVGLRIRIFQTYGEQTLKVPIEATDHHLIEITDRLTLQQAQGFSQAQTILVPSSVADKLATLNIDLADLEIIGQATTTRHICHIPAGILTLDQTNYPDKKIDYELELELESKNSGLQSAAYFTSLLRKNKITKRPVTNKVARAVAHFSL